MGPARRFAKDDGDDYGRCDLQHAAKVAARCLGVASEEHPL